MNYLAHQGGRRAGIAQDRPLTPEQVENSAGGFVWKVDPFVRLERFLILGSEGGSYYASERDLTYENVQCVQECLREDAYRAIATAENISTRGRAAKNDPAIYLLAQAASSGDERTIARAYKALPRICRYTTDLFKFLNYLKLNRGLGGNGLKRALGRWYGSLDHGSEFTEDAILARVAYQATKYRNREGWTHRDGLRVSHARPAFDRSGVDPRLDALYAWIVGKPVDEEIRSELPKIVRGFEAAQKTKNVRRMVQLIQTYGLTHEMIPDDMKTPAVWAALLENMPMTATIRNLATATRNGALKPLGKLTDTVCKRIVDPDNLKRARVHPITILSALNTYSAGTPLRGRGENWNPIAEVVDALETAFYAAFDYLEPTGKRMLLAVDTSASMSGREEDWPNCAGMPELAPITGAAIMAMVQARVGDPYHVIGFARPGHARILDISKKDSLEQVQTKMQVGYGSTDASVPMLYAEQEGIEVDCFALYTDNESWAGHMHPQQALEKYRRNYVKDSKMVTVSMVANPYSVVDPNDPRTLEIVGFDTNAPSIISRFAADEL